MNYLIGILVMAAIVIVYLGILIVCEFLNTDVFGLFLGIFFVFFWILVFWKIPPIIGSFVMEAFK